MPDTELQALQQIFAGDKFAAATQIIIESFSPMGACCTVEPKEMHRNITGAVQGGVLFTLGDFCFAVAANARHLLDHSGQVVITLSNTISYIRQPKGHKLIAIAEKISAGHKTCEYRVSITDELDTPVAELLVNGYTVPYQF